MEVNSVLDNLGLRRDFTEQADATNELDQNTFLRLFIAQLENQDPLDPSSSEEFVAQLAQFSSLEQATQTTSLLEELLAQGTERGRFEAVALIGHEVLATGNTVELDSDGVGNLVYQVAGNISSGTITITDLTGKVVRSLILETQAAGQQTIEWDGLDNEGEPVSPGVYQFAVNPLNAEGATVSVITFLRESVKSAVWENGQTELILASGKSLSTDDVLSVF
ncbi:MAG: flagellar hook assembly protein FlgD [Nitrospirales bacterium]